MPGLHASFAPSAAKRLIACPMSYWLGQQAIATSPLAGQSSVYAAEGTAAHSLAEYILLGGQAPDKPYKIAVEGHSITVDMTMLDYVRVYIRHIEDTMTRAGNQALVWYEQKVSVVAGLPASAKLAGLEIWGTSDCIIFDRATGIVYVIDLKYGSGIVVEVVDNEQLLTYAVGVLEFIRRVAPGWSVREVQLHIVQPRAEHEDGPIRTDTWAALDIHIWRDEVLLPAVREILGESPRIEPGEHCRFCPAVAICPERRKLAQRIAQAQFLAAQVDNEQLGEALGWTKALERWIEAVKEESLSRAMRGQHIPGHKLVKKISRRQWADETAAHEAMDALGLQPSDYLVMETRSPSDLEKAVSGAVINALTKQGHIVKPDAGLTIAPDSDRRPEVKVQPAADVFSNNPPENAPAPVAAPIPNLFF